DLGDALELDHFPPGLRVLPASQHLKKRRRSGTSIPAISLALRTIWITTLVGGGYGLWRSSLRRCAPTGRMVSVRREPAVSLPRPREVPPVAAYRRWSALTHPPTASLN